MYDNNIQSYKLYDFYSSLVVFANAFTLIDTLKDRTDEYYIIFRFKKINSLIVMFLNVNMHI